jgi:uncharacterized membrane protein
MMIVITTMFLLLPVLVALYLSVSGVFTNRRSFQSVFYALLAFFALTIGISMVMLYSSQRDAPQATTQMSLSEAVSEPL